MNHRHELALAVTLGSAALLSWALMIYMLQSQLRVPLMA